MPSPLNSIKGVYLRVLDVSFCRAFLYLTKTQREPGILLRLLYMGTLIYDRTSKKVKLPLLRAYV
jgi:hypothetical protein